MHSLPGEPDKFSRDRSASGPPGPADTVVSRPTVDWDASGPSTVDARPAPVDRFIGRQFGRYTILDRLGKGGMGIVYRARDAVLGREVALKFITSGMLASERELRRFYREAQAVAQLDHPHIIKIYDFGELEGEHYFTMGLAAGGSLAQHRQRFTDNPRATVELLLKIAQAVHHIHLQGVLHRDLKPGNILLEAGDKPLVTDFGLAKPIEPEDELTRPGDAPGTPAYMAPEQAGKHNDQVCKQTDIWALGVILYELLCGQKPFTGDSEQVILSAVQSSDPPAPRSLKKSIDFWLEVIILKCLEKNLKDRYDTAGELADDLDRWLRGEIPKGRRAPWWRRAGRWARRRPAKTAAAIFCFAFVLAVPTLLEMRDEERFVKSEIYPRLQAGENVVLIGETTAPNWSRWRLPGVIDPKPRDAAGRENATAFSVNSGTLSLLELMPSVPLERYSFRATIKKVVEPLNVLHQSNQGVGIYLSYSLYEGDVHAFIPFSIFDDVPTRELLEELDADPSVVRHFIASVGKLHYCPTGTHRQMGSAAEASRGLLAEHESWHELKVDVQPEGMVFSLDGYVVHRMSTETRKRSAGKQFMPRFDLPGVSDEFSPQHGIGIYIRRAKGFFKNVVVEPLKEPA